MSNDEHIPSVELGPIDRVVAQLSSPPGLMTSQYEGKRAGVLTRSIQVCADDPVLLSLVIARGHSIAPLIRDSHGFAVCLLAGDDRLTRRRFAQQARAEPTSDQDDDHDDPFDAFRVSELVSGSPIIDRAVAVLDCEVVRHFDLEADHEIYVGQVLATRVFNEAALAALRGGTG